MFEQIATAAGLLIIAASLGEIALQLARCGAVNHVRSNGRHGALITRRQRSDQ
jgi:hypothetical protein